MAPDYSTVTFWDLALLSDSHVIAVSGSGGAIETLDGGITWTAIAGITTPLYGIDYTDGLAYLVGSGGTVYSYDGTTCNLMPQSLTTNDLAGVCALGSEIWAVGGYYMVEGTILHSSDGGANWEPQTSGVNTALMEVDFTDADHGCAVGFDNTIVYTSDGGANWTQAANTSLDPASSVMWVTALEGEVFYAVASTGMNGDSWIMRSTDGGANWTLVEEITGEWLFSLDVLRNEDNPDTVDIWAVGLAAATHHFTDTLPLPPVPFTGDLACVRMLDSDTVWACGVGIVRSENSGPWEDMAPDYSTVTFWDLALLSDSHVIAVSGSGGAIETLDGGITWTAIAGITTPLYGIDYTDGLAYLVGSGGTVYSYDGTTCNLMPQSLTTNDLAGVCALGSEIWAVGGYYMVEGTILHSSDGGANWEPQTSGVNTALMEVDFTDADHGCAVGFDNTIVYTSDGGANWTQAANTSLDPASSVMWVTALEGEVFYAVASTGMNGDSWIMRSTDGGANWTLVETMDRRMAIQPRRPA